MGRGSKKSPELKQAIVDRVSAGETLTSICRDIGVATRTVYDWMEADPELSAQFASARARGYDAIADECLSIADDDSQDYIETEDGPALNREHIQRSKLRVETRLKLLAKWDPKRYGERLQADVNGGLSLKIVSEFDGQ